MYGGMGGMYGGGMYGGMGSMMGGSRYNNQQHMMQNMQESEFFVPRPPPGVQPPGKLDDFWCANERTLDNVGRVGDCCRSLGESAQAAVIRIRALLSRRSVAPVLTHERMRLVAWLAVAAAVLSVLSAGRTGAARAKRRKTQLLALQSAAAAKAMAVQWPAA
eukprot:NODE_24178_length_635_cov_4.795276.p1 GENE.NODE_24178_length_635_cov_4.795276~~NODE_24178_length_635_cov_4.795276.p1  ORF type:complete len:162 (+),score=46.45 NODE_24178_length_635_cov_4.795276:103-588(+)